MARLRQLVVVADDFGIGPETDRGILDAAACGAVTATVLLVNSPYAKAAVAAWNRAGRPIELGWHPNLTLDQPILPPEKVPSLVNNQGKFHPLGRFIRNSVLGRLRPFDVYSELEAQYRRFVELVGLPPRFLNSHQHTALFWPVYAALRDILQEAGQRPFVRRVREPWQMLRWIPGARIKRFVLNRRGRHVARILESDGFPGCDWLAGITDPPFVANPEFYSRWLSAVPGQTVELMVHPGHRDETLVGRDCEPGDEVSLLRRVRELEMLKQPSFREAVRAAGFELAPPSRIASAEIAAAA